MVIGTSSATGADPGNDASGVDETGGGAIPVPIDGSTCLYDDLGEDGFYGYRYQCAGSINLDIVVSHPFNDSPEPTPLGLSFGHGVDDDSYADPKVMACCPWYDVHAPACEQPHERACFIDLVEQGCKSMVGKIEDFAHEQFPGVGNAAKRLAVLKVADHVREHQEDCVAAFRKETGILEHQPTCDQNGNSVDYTSMLEDGEWSFDPDGAVDLVEISVAEAEWHGLYPIGADSNATSICQSADENDDVVFLEIDPAPGSEIRHLVAGSVTLQGPDVAGFGELRSTSILAVAPASLENLVLHSAGEAVIVAGVSRVPVDAFHVRLWARADTKVEGHTLTVQPGSARFAVGVVVLGHNAVQTATNATPIVITRGDDGWRTSPFSITSTHLGEEVSLAVAPARWQ
jgi:hypothetical protein